MCALQHGKLSANFRFPSGRYRTTAGTAQLPVPHNCRWRTIRNYRCAGSESRAVAPQQAGRHRSAGGPPSARRAVAQQWRVEGLRLAAPVQRSRTAGLRYPPGVGGLDEPFGVRDLPAEVPRVKRHSPDDLIDVAQIADGEHRAAERGSERGELQMGPGTLDGVVQNLGVVEGERTAHLVDRCP